MILFENEDGDVKWLKNRDGKEGHLISQIGYTPVWMG